MTILEMPNFLQLAFENTYDILGVQEKEQKQNVRLLKAFWNHSKTV
jgi:hypothetical protein